MEQTVTTVRSEVEDGVGIVTLADARRRNPLSVATMRALTATLRELSARGVGAVVLTHEGPAFSAGHDLSEMVDRTLDDEREVFAVCTELMTTVQQIPQPVVAAVDGMAVAAGCQLVATCDLAVVSTASVFGTPGVRIGLFCSTPMVAVSRAVGRKRALQMLLTGDTIDAATAADWGLVNEVVEPGAVRERAVELARRIGSASALTLAIGKQAFYRQIAAASPLTLAIGKQAFYRQIDLPQAEAYADMQEVMATNAVTCDAQEGMQAFLGKRQPTWTGR